MSPFGVSSALPDQNSSSPLIMEPTPESSTLPSTVSENPSQSSCQESQTLSEAICYIRTPNGAYSQFTSNKVVKVSPVISFNTGFISDVTVKRNLTDSYKKDTHTLENSSGACDLNTTKEFITESEKQNQRNGEKCSSDKPELKVVVQAMPTGYRNISALKEVIHDTISRKSWLKMKSRQNKTITKHKLKDDQEWNPGRSKILKEATNNASKSDDSELFSSNCSERPKLNPRLCFDIEPGKGMKLSEIQNVATAIRKCSERTLQVIHYLLFNTYGGVGYDRSIKQTLRNIMDFSGYPFPVFSSAYNKKYQCMMRLPYQMLLKIYKVLVQQMSVERPTMVTELMKFCMKPVRTLKLPDLKSNEVYDASYLEELKNHAIKGPSPLIVLEKLNESYIKEMESKSFEKEKNLKTQGKDIFDYFPNYVKPSFIHQGPGCQLKEFSHVSTGIFKARRRIVNLIHCLLFKRPGSLDNNRLNILEFSGFLKKDNDFLERKLQTLNRYKQKDLDQIFDVFHLKPRESKLKRMRKLLLFLQAPSAPKRKRNIHKVQQEGGRASKEKKSAHGILTSKHKLVVPRLRDIETVCRNIECAPPNVLAPLYDLLFIKPCDISEIHEKILNFSPFQFDENSVEFHYRKLLMHYMNFGILRRIAHILDINWERYEFHEDLSDAILNFLMKMEKPVQRRRNRRQPRNFRISNENSRPTILKVERHRRSFEQETPVSSSTGARTCNSPNNRRLGSYAGNENSTVVIRRISDSSYSWTDSRIDGPFTVSDSNSDECLTLNEFAHHPTEDQLELTIKDVICSNSWNISTGDLLNKVHHRYPKLNITYRNDFIKSKALKILHEMQECMVDSTFDD